MNIKTCNRCLTSKEETEFGKATRNTCKTCWNAYQKAYRDNNPERTKELRIAWQAKNRQKVNAQGSEWRKANPNKVRSFKLKTRYGITQEDYLIMYAEQKGICKICEKYFEKLVVDHCHTTLKIRGLLCQKCNAGIGFLTENENALNNAIKYVKGDI